MTQVDFHILEDADYNQSLQFACAQIEKAHANNETVHVHTRTREEAEHLDDLLWSFRDDAFVPHQLFDANENDYAPVTIGYSHTHAKQDVLINLCDVVPDFFSDYTRIIEIIYSDSEIQQLGRERYKQYRSHACDLNTHKIKVNA
jgi:DNA polymerase-3 subunit chi